MLFLRRLGFGLLPSVLVGLLCLGGCSHGKKRIIILTNGTSPYWDACREGMKQAEKEFKLQDAGLEAGLEVNDGTVGGQLEKLKQFGRQSDIVAIGISPIDASNAALAEELRALKKKGITVITIDSDLDREKFRESRAAYLGTDNYAAGQVLGICIRGLRPKGGEYVNFVGLTGAQNAIDRIGGVKNGAGPGFKELDTMPDDFKLDRARKNVRDAIQNHPGANTFVGIYSYNGPAIAEVVDEKKVRQKLKVAVFDAEPDAISSMGKDLIDVMVVQNPYEMGYQGVRLMKALVKDDKGGKDTVKEMLPKLAEKDGDIYDTGLRVVVPDEGSPLTAEAFKGNADFIKLSAFREWLAKHNLTGS